MLRGARSRCGSLAAVVTALAALASAAPGSATADTLIAAEQRPTALDADAGVVAWNTYLPETRRWALKVRRDGAAARLGVPSRRVPFDFDLGRDRRGRQVAVYSRCVRDPDSGSGPSLRADLASASGCDVRLYNFRTGREARLRGASTRTWSEYAPAIWGRYVAFVRVRERKRRVTDAIPRVHLLDTRTGRVRRLFSGTLGAWSRLDDGYFGGFGPGELDLRGRSLVFATEALVVRCNGRTNPTGDYLNRTELWAVTLSGTRRRVDVACATDAVRSPSIVGRDVVYATRGAVARVPLSGGSRAFARLDHPVNAVAGAGASLFYSGHASFEQTGSVFEASGVAFVDAPPAGG